MMHPEKPMETKDMTQSSEMLARNEKVIPGGVVSTNRRVEPVISFVRAQGGRMWDADGKEYLDYHGAFAPMILGHNDPDVNAAVIASIDRGESLIGSGPTRWEGELAELIVEAVPGVEMVQITNTGSEATAHAIRLSRAATGRDGVVLMEGGYNGWHNDVAFNLMTPADALGDYRPGMIEPLRPLSAGIPASVGDHIRVINFNDLPAAEAVLRGGDVACVLTEPILQNIGIVKPENGYLAGLRKLCDDTGTVLVFDEIKTGFRHALGGYQSVCGVLPDLCTFGKAVANGYPLGVIGGKRALMEQFAASEANRRVMIAGTYNAHPLTCAAAIATIRKLADPEENVYGHIRRLGKRMQKGLAEIFAKKGMAATIAREGSAWCVYFMASEPKNWHDIAKRHDFDLDRRYRAGLIERRIYPFPLPVKQSSICYAHTTADIDETLEKTREVVKGL
jgi:glutamate-1-semialdehyde 2,1-aminomutase